jgi:hypothetical protein
MPACYCPQGSTATAPARPVAKPDALHQPADIGNHPTHSLQRFGRSANVQNLNAGMLHFHPFIGEAGVGRNSEAQSAIFTQALEFSNAAAPALLFVTSLPI